jgi:hypothetical protein
VYLCCVEREKERKVVGIDEILCLCVVRERERKRDGKSKKERM